MKVLDLFSGIGGFSLGLERAGFETIAFCEIEEFPRKVLRKHWPDVPIFEDVRELTANDLPERADVIVGGYPCQPFSVAGKRAGKNDNRHLWPEFYRLIRECSSAWVIAENVAGHISMGLDEVLFDLERAGYTWETFVIPACAVDAPHRRDRVWIVAHVDDNRRRGAIQSIHELWSRETANAGRDGEIQFLVNTKGFRQQPGRRSGNGALQRKNRAQNTDDRCATDADRDIERLEIRQRQDARRAGPQIWSKPFGACRWPAEPALGRVANGVPRRVDRLRALGNAVVPQIPEIIGRAIMEVEACKEA